MIRAVFSTTYLKTNKQAKCSFLQKCSFRDLSILSLDLKCHQCTCSIATGTAWDTVPTYVTDLYCLHACDPSERQGHVYSKHWDGIYCQRLLFSYESSIQQYTWQYCNSVTGSLAVMASEERAQKFRTDDESLPRSG